MKKNRMMRLASILLVCVLLTTSVISGTFAKYVTTNGGSDTAQVAKFGVVINVDNDLGLFDTAYAKSDSQYTSELSVKSSATSQMVAPGTKGSMSFNITGVPEVATRVSIKFDEDACKAVTLEDGEYTLPAGAFEAAEKKVTTTTVYEPIKFYFGTEEIGENTAYTLTLKELQAKMSTEFTKDYEPNYSFGDNGTTYYLGWSWAFEDTTVTNVNFLDTYLGYEAATSTARQEVLDFDITVTQID